MIVSTNNNSKLNGKILKNI